MFFTYPAATTSPNVLGRRWFSKLYLRSACVSSASAAFSSASDALESVAAVPASLAEGDPDFSESSAAVGCPAAGFRPWDDSVVETSVPGEVSGVFPQPTKRSTKIGMQMQT